MKNKITFLFVLTFNMSFAQTAKDINSIVEKSRQKYNVPAIAASVIHYDTIHYGISGVKRVTENDKVDINSKFHLGSNTKAITSFIAAKMVENGQIEWQTKLLEVLPELKNQIRTNYYNITLEELLSHRAMVSPFEDDTSKEWRKIPKTINEAQNKKLEFAKYALNIKPAKSEKANHLYSNGGYIIAGLMLEVRSGESWNALVANTLSDLGIDHYIGFPNQENGDSTYGHKKRGKKYNIVLPSEEYPIDNYFSPAGNCSLSIKGFSKFVQLHLKGLMGESNYLKSETYEKMHFGEKSYSLGWYNGNIGDTDQKFSYHGGSLGTYSSAVIISADRKVAIVILVNADNEDVNKLKNELRVNLWETYGVKK